MRALGLKPILGAGLGGLAAIAGDCIFGLNEIAVVIGVRFSCNLNVGWANQKLVSIQRFFFFFLVSLVSGLVFSLFSLYVIRNFSSFESIWSISGGISSGSSSSSFWSTYGAAKPPDCDGLGVSSCLPAEGLV